MILLVDNQTLKMPLVLTCQQGLLWKIDHLSSKKQKKLV